MFWKKGKFIDDDTKNDEITNVMELAIHHCKGREIKDTIIVAYLLEYYSRHATDYAGWMSTVSKALPLLFKYNYDDCVTKLFRKECFANQNYFSAQDPYNIIPEEYQERRNHNIKFRAFGVNLRSNEYKWYGGILKSLESLKIKTYKFFGELDNNDVEKKPLALRVVPLPEFTTNRINQQEEVELMSIMLRDFHYSNGFGNVEIIDTKLIVWMSVTIFFLWMEAISYLRLIPNIATYIYYVKIITKAVFPFLLFNIVVIMAFAHTMLILLKETKNIETKDTTFSGTATNPVNGQELDVKMKADFHPDDMNDNPFSYFPTAIVATYYWLNGDFIQRDEFDFWAVEVLSLIASILLVTILQNMLIAFMGGVYQKAETKEDNKMKINKNDDNNKNVKQKNKVDNIEKEIKNDDNIKDIKKDIKDDDIEAIKEDIKKIGIENMKNMNDIIGRLLKTLN
ncbi:unnamed protein product [Rhizophagus irregularis]|nr:unnamed protein product [Rhizophagus irregularis]